MVRSSVEVIIEEKVRPDSAIKRVNNPWPCPKRPDGNQHTMGLANVGMTCFINSVLNSLYFVPQFYQYFYATTATTTLVSLIKEFVTKYGKREIAPKLLREIAAHFPKFPLGEMGSAFDFLLNMLQGLDEETQQRPASSSVLHAYGSRSFHDIFSILVEDSRKCNVCNATVSNLVEMNALFFNIAQKHPVRIGRDKLSPKASLPLSLEAFLSEQPDSPETPHTCRRCNQDQIHINKKSIKQIGSAVVIYLQRFTSLNPQALVTVPQTLDMSKYLEGVGSYTLSSVVHHSGDLRWGHYKCFANSANGWMCLNDRNATFVKDPWSEISASTLFIYCLE